MIPELGHFAMILAMLLALAQGTLPIIGAHKGVAEWMALARPAAQAQFAFVLFAWFCLVLSFVGDEGGHQAAPGKQHEDELRLRRGAGECHPLGHALVCADDGQRALGERQQHRQDHCEVSEFGNHASPSVIRCP